ncbi:hypothetical protein LZ31DRAFT_553837 [Colletotrichum somersetense]|nr:hypothetical protein LZ31DRAFT_553837 [Colletotrichum somersetense]
MNSFRQAHTQKAHSQGCSRARGDAMVRGGFISRTAVATSTLLQTSIHGMSGDQSSLWIESIVLGCG